MPGQKQQQRFNVVEIATNTEPRIKDTKTGKLMDLYEAWSKVLNDIEEMKSFLIGGK